MPSTRVPQLVPDVQDLDCNDVNPTAVVQALITSGGVLLQNFVPNQEVGQTRRVYGFAGKSSKFMHNIVANPIYQAVCDKLLSSTHRCYIGDKIEESLSPPQLNNTLVLSIGLGARAQDLHRDDMIHRNSLTEITAEEYVSGRDTGIGLFVAAKPVTRANGATRFIPGSHLWDTMRPPQEELAVHAEMTPGDAFIILSSCYHGGSANTTSNEERLLYSCFMTKGFLRQEENQYLSVPEEAVKEYPLEMQQLIGYRVSKPFLGWIDLQDPRKALYGDEWREENWRRFALKHEARDSERHVRL